MSQEMNFFNNIPIENKGEEKSFIKTNIFNTIVQSISSSPFKRSSGNNKNIPKNSLLLNSDKNYRIKKPLFFLSISKKDPNLTPFQLFELKRNSVRHEIRRKSDKNKQEYYSNYNNELDANNKIHNKENIILSKSSNLTSSKIPNLPSINQFKTIQTKLSVLEVSETNEQMHTTRLKMDHTPDFLKEFQINNLKQQFSTRNKKISLSENKNTEYKTHTNDFVRNNTKSFYSKKSSVKTSQIFKNSNIKKTLNFTESFASINGSKSFNKINKEIFTTPIKKEN